MAERGPSGNFFTRWRKRRRAYRESRHLIKESRRILRKYGFRIKEEVAEEVKGAIEALREAMAGKRFQAVRDRLEKLDELVDKHLAFGRKSALREYAESIGIAVLVALLLRAFVVEAFKIPSGSMLPTLEVGDHLFVNKFIYGPRIPWTHRKFFAGRAPRRGEVIVFIFPGDEGKDFIKRIVAVGGDTVAVEDSVVHINGKPVKRREIPGPCSFLDLGEDSEVSLNLEPSPCTAYEEELDDTRYRVIQDLTAISEDRSRFFHPLTLDSPFKVPEGQVFVMGDNRNNSHDSRFWGTVPWGNIKGKAMVIWWSSGDPDGIRWRRFFHLVHADDPVVKPAR